MMPKKIIRAVTVSQSVGFFVGLIPELQEMGYEVVAVSTDGPELQSVREAGGRIIIVEMERHISPLKDLKSLWQMIKVFRLERPDMVHSMTPKAGLICMMAAKLVGVPVRVHTFTGLVFPTSSGLKRKLLMATDRITCWCASHIIPEGEGVKRDLLQNDITKKDIHVLGYGNCKGIDLEHFNPDREYDVETAPDAKPLPKLFEVEKSVEFSKNQNLKPISKIDYMTFICIGRIVGDKGINELVFAFTELNKEYPKTRLILLGHTECRLGRLEPETLEIIRTHKDIEAVGLQYDIRPWLSVSDCAILASYREGFPNAVIEAGAMGLPQIVTNINGANEIIVEGENGTIVPPRDTDALYSAMKRMITDTEWHQSLASKARPMIASRYDQHFVRKCLYDFYDEILDGKSKK